MLVVAEIADISPICSIMEAIAIGAITRTAVISNLQNLNAGIPTHAESLIAAKLKIAEPSGFVMPAMCIIRAMTYETAIPIRIGMILNSPLPHTLNTMIVARATIARNQLVEALPIAEPARESPIQMMIGPVTTGGRNRITFFMPTTLMMRARMKYARPAITTPPQAYAAFSFAPMLA